MERLVLLEQKPVKKTDLKLNESRNFPRRRFLVTWNRTKADRKAFKVVIADFKQSIFDETSTLSKLLFYCVL